MDVLDVNPYVSYVLGHQTVLIGGYGDIQAYRVLPDDGW